MTAYAYGCAALTVYKPRIADALQGIYRVLAQGMLPQDTLLQMMGYFRL